MIGLSHCVIEIMLSKHSSVFGFLEEFGHRVLQISVSFILYQYS